MSTCISRHGEYGSHLPGEDRFICDRCFVFDEDAAMAALVATESQLAAAQAQLAEAREHAACAEAALEVVGEYRDAAEARLEAVRALRSRWEAERTYLSAEQEPIAAAYIELLDAALSAAPQPEPVVAPYETPEEAAANDAIPAEPISPEFRQRLIAAVERPLRVRRAILLLAGHASGHLPGFDRGCRVCRRDWPCEDTQRAAAPALEAFADATPEPPASAETDREV